MSYAADHASAKADVRAAGAPITFVRSMPGAEQPDGTFIGPASDAVLAYATEMEEGDAAEYARLGLTQSEAPTLFVVCDAYGDAPVVGARALWGGTTWTVKAVQAYRPDGVPLTSTVVIAR
jgi:hypothetical protein